ncbi:uncharacterized protein V6R79_016616 [Siganus canaliculatus]
MSFSPSTHSHVCLPTQTPVSNAGCGTTRICAAEPSSCNPNGTGTCYFLSASLTSGRNFDFTLSGQSDGYVAATLSLDSVLGGNDVTYVCANNNGVVQFFGALLNNGQLTKTELNVNSVKGSVNGTTIQCTFSATVPSLSTRATAQNFTVAVSIGSFDSSSGTLGNPTTQLRSNTVDLTSPTTTVTNQLNSTTTVAPATTSHAITFQQSLVHGHLLVNVALNQSATQSSVESDSHADRAVDGNRDPDHSHGSCTLTKQETDPWWQVDLKMVYKVAAVMITNRQFNPSRLDGAEIWIVNSTVMTNLDDTGGIRCAVVSHVPSRQTFYFPCGPIEGRYVKVVLPGTEALSLCEVEVFTADFVHPLPNVARKGDASQSSTLSHAAASKAIDGRRNSFYSNDSCSHTDVNQTNPWWRVDLRQTFIISTVKVTNRGDCCAGRLDGAEIRIGNSLDDIESNKSRCATISHINEGNTAAFHCDGGNMAGRFVTVIIPGNNKTLTLCEVEVYATPEVKPLPNVALKKSAAQSTVSEGRAAYKAVDGRISEPFNTYCIRTQSGPSPWWKVDLSEEYRVSAVTIIKSELSLLGAQIRIGNSGLILGNPKCGTIPTDLDLAVYTFDCADMRGRYITVSFPESNRILSLCEVEVFGSPTEPEAVHSSPPTPAPPPPPSTASMPLPSGGNAVVVRKELCWSDALLYCRHYQWDLLSIRSREEQDKVEKLLKDSPFPITRHVWLGLRRSLMRNDWFWMSGSSMTFTKWLQDLAPDSLSHPCGGIAARGRYLWEDQPCEKHLNFICQSRAEDEPERRYFSSTLVMEFVDQKEPEQQQQQEQDQQQEQEQDQQQEEEQQQEQEQEQEQALVT